MGTEKCSLCENSKKKLGGGGGGGGRVGEGGVRVDVNGKVKLLRKFKKNFLGGVGSGGGGGVRVDGNGELKLL